MPLPACLPSFVSLHDFHSAAAVLSPRLVSGPSWSPCWAALSCRCRLVSQACLPSKSHMLSSFLGLMFLALWVGRCYLGSIRCNLSPCMLITEIAAAPASSFVSLHLSPCVLISKIPASSFVSLHLSPCMLITEIPAAPSLPSFVSLHLSPCMLIPKIPASSFVSLHADYRNRCRS